MVLRSRTIGAADIGSTGSAAARIGTGESDLGSEDGRELSLINEGSANGSSCFGVGIVGVWTISPQSSSSSSTGGCAAWVVEVEGVSKLEKSAQGSDASAAGCDIGGEMGFATAVVSKTVCDTVAVRLCVDCSGLREVRSTDTARPSCRCSLATAGFFNANGVEDDRCAGLSNFHGSADTGELQSNAAALFVAKGGKLCLAGGAVFVAGMEDCVREWPKGVLDSGGAGVSQ